MPDTTHRICRFCGSPIDTENPRALYCSTRCRRKYQDERRKTEREERALACAGRGVCPVCGREFRRKFEGHFYCSRRCANEGNRRGLKVHNAPMTDPFDPDFIASLDWWDAVELYANTCLDPLPVGVGSRTEQEKYLLISE